MFDRALFKSNAKLCLKRYYWLAVLATLITAALAGGAIAGTGSSSANFSVPNSASANLESSGDFEEIINQLNDIQTGGIQTDGEQLEVYDPMPDYVPEPAAETEVPDLNEIGSQISETLSENVPTAAVVAIIAVVAGIIVLATALGVVRGLFVTNQIEVGNRRFFLSAREARPSIGTLFWSYKNSMRATMGSLFCRDLFLTLWSLPAVLVPTIGCTIGVIVLLNSSRTIGVIILAATFLLSLAAFIPYFVKAYQYFPVAWLRAENPGMSRSRVFELSKAMTDGYKWKLFVLDLSFIGWWLLTIFSCGVGGLFLAPYILATKAEAYTFLKTKAIEGGCASVDEFAGFASAQPAEQIQTVGGSEFVVEPYTE